MPRQCTAVEGRCYLLNSAVITADGLYRYTALQLEAASVWLLAAPVVSCIRYAETVDALERLVGLPEGTLAVSDRTISMQPGDEALCFRPAYPAGVRYGVDSLTQHYTLGLLVRLVEPGP